jgi:acyl-CoA thioesterase I
LNCRAVEQVNVLENWYVWDETSFNKVFCMKRILTLLPILFVTIMLSCTSQTDQSGVEVPSQPEQPENSAPESADSRKTILFFGDSITAGYGIDEQEAFPALIQQRLDSIGLQWRAVNAGLSGETSAGGLRRIDWLLRQPVDVMVLELGGNDGLRGVSPDDTRRNLEEIIDRTRAKYPDVRIILAGMQIPPNLGPEYAAAFAGLYTDVARSKQVELIPFILEGVGGISELNLPDGIHPTAEGHKILAETVWAKLDLENRP